MKILNSAVDLSTSASMFDEVSLWSSRFGALLFEHLELRDDLDILDVGCGTGFPLIELAAVHGEGCRVTGVDVWKDALERAKVKIAWLGMTNVTVVEGDAAKLPFDDDSFDLIVSNLGVNNFDNAERVFAECARVARKSGRLVITTNCQGHMSEVYDVFREVLPQRYHKRIEASEKRRATREELEASYVAAGFDVTRVFTAEFGMTFSHGKALLRHPLTRWFGWREIVDADDFAAVFAEVERAIDRPIRTTIPMLYVEGAKAAVSS
jgi:ubiquinone/menaquinone biosynthesis C-methylase UbiE